MDHEEFDHWDQERKRRRTERDARRADQRQVHSEEGDGPGRGDPRGARKAKVLHTRISKQLDESLRSAADEMRVPVSNLVRNVLEDVFDVVETVTENVEDLVGDLMDEAGLARERFGRRRRHRERRWPVGREWEPAETLSPEQRAEARRKAEQELREVEGEVVVGQEPEASAAPSEPDPADVERQEFPQVLGWHPLVLNGEQRCADCGRDLRRGDRGYLGLGDGGGTGIYLCSECLEARS